MYRNAAEVGVPRNRIFVAGHSAGGHLTAMCMAAQWSRYSRGLPEKVMQGAMSISGIYDLVPIARTPSINVDVRLTANPVRHPEFGFVRTQADPVLVQAPGNAEKLVLRRPPSI